jgi:hypothetical protein
MNHLLPFQILQGHQNLPNDLPNCRLIQFLDLVQTRYKVVPFVALCDNVVLPVILPYVVDTLYTRVVYLFDRLELLKFVAW